MRRPAPPAAGADRSAGAVRAAWAGVAVSPGFGYGTRMPRNVATALGPMTALDAEGRALSLGGFWRERTAVLAFVRHFG